MRDKVHSMDEEYSVIGRRCDYHLTLSDNFLTLHAGRFKSFVDISNTIRHRQTMFQHSKQKRYLVIAQSFNNLAEPPV